MSDHQNPAPTGPGSPGNQAQPEQPVTRQPAQTTVSQPESRTSRRDTREKDAARAERAVTLPADVEWRRVHPVTPLLEGWRIITATLAFVTFQNLDELTSLVEAVREHGITFEHPAVRWGAGLILVVLLLIGAGLVLAWRARSFAVDRDGVYLRTGVLSKQLRTARLPRIQAVDVVHPLLGRVLGLGQLTVEVAGGGDSRIVIGYLPTTELITLRDTILDLAAGARTVSAVATPGSHSPQAADDPAGVRGGSPAGPHHVDALLGGDLDAVAPLPAGRLAAEEEPLYTVQTPVLIGSVLRSGLMIAFVLTLLTVVGGMVVLPLVLTGSLLDPAEGVLSAVSGLLAVLVIPFSFGSLVWSRLSNGWGFRAAATPAGIRARFGLTSDTSTTLPPGRVHAVGLSQGLLWRGKDWWRVQAAVAGRETADVSSGGGVQEKGTSTLLPVGDRDTALRALWLVTPDLGVTDPDALLDAVLTGQDDDGVGDPTAPVDSPQRGLVRVPRRARVFNWVAWRRKGVVLTDTCVILRGGRLQRTVSVIPYERIQSVHVSQGPLARRRDLAELRLDIVNMTLATTSATTITNLDATEAGQLARAVSDRALRRGSSEELDRWLARAVAAPALASEDGAGRTDDQDGEVGEDGSAGGNGGSESSFVPA